MRKLLSSSAILFIVVCLNIPSVAVAQSLDEPVVEAILFYSPTCGHCHYVINEVLVPLLNEYGDQLQIVEIDYSQPDGAQLYQAAVEQYQIPPGRRGVPTLITGDVVLVGSKEIPELFPALVEQGLAADGVGWPDIPGLDQVLAKDYEREVLSSEEQDPPPDPLGSALAGVVLAGLVLACIYAVWRVALARQRLVRLSGQESVIQAKTWVIPLLAVLGLGVAMYLAYVETTQVKAVCGPIGECNVVQTSEYARILGIPVAVLGVLNYLAIGVLWVGQRLPARRWANLSALGLLGLTLFGVLFSIYLTYLELFVIHAICAWCLCSAIVTMLTLFLVTGSMKGKSHDD